MSTKRPTMGERARTRARAMLDSVHHRVSGPIYDVQHHGQQCRLSMERPHHRIRTPGAFEPAVMDVLDETVTAESTFWEVGARWGVFSFLWADRCRDVHAFEAAPERVQHLLRSRDVNAADNVHVHSVWLSGEHTLDAYRPAPDVAVVDLEGMEYELLPASEETLARGGTWIVEAHEFEALDGEPADLVRLFERLGFDIRRVPDSERRRTHLIAGKT